MLKQLFQALLVLSFASSAFAQNAGTTIEKASKETPQDQFASYVMKGFSAGLEFSQINADVKIKVKDNSSGATGELTGNSNEGAGAIGVSVNYSQLPRARAGYLLGLGIISKVENDANKTQSMKATKGFTQLRPEANVGYALSNGLWGAVGGHGSIVLGGDIQDQMKPFGMGLQASIGYVPAKNFGFDIGYYLTLHAPSDKVISALEDIGLTVEKSESWYTLKQLRARGTYYF